ncbi:MAG: XRE family transcriptional regulator [Pseudomonadota bacterium]|nr:XRE family transcriptional regulator [Pseudomonadota bacterium]
MVRIRPIRDEDSYSATLAAIELFFDDQPAPGTPEADDFAVLLDLIAAYEARRWPITASDPIAMIVNTMALTQRGQSDLAELLGSRSRASEILNRKRHLTIKQVYAISQAWNIPADALITPYELTA